MASVAKRPNGKRIVQFVGLDKKRKTIDLGERAESTCEEIALHVENLVEAKRRRKSPPAKTERWLNKQADALLDKLRAAGLIDELPDATLGGFTRAYIDSRQDIKPMTRENLTYARRYLVERFGADKPLDSITAGDADEYRRWLRQEKKIGENTARRHCGRAKQFFRAAVRKRLIDDNPFADMKELSVRGNKERFAFVDRADAQKVLDACPDAQWKLLFALARFGGLRCPSEPLRLTWGDIDWDRGRVLIRSPKTEHYEGKESRLLPLFPELRPYLEAAFGAGGRGAAEFVITIQSIRRDRYANVRTRMEKILERAGVKRWPKLFHNLRATRQTELVHAGFAEYVVDEWMGNSPRVAREHYLRVIDSHFDLAQKLETSTPLSARAALPEAPALQIALQPPVEADSPTPSFGATQVHSWTVLDNSIPPAGLEPAT